MGEVKRSSTRLAPASLVLSPPSMRSHSSRSSRFSLPPVYLHLPRQLYPQTPPLYLLRVSVPNFTRLSKQLQNITNITSNANNPSANNTSSPDPSPSSLTFVLPIAVQVARPSVTQTSVEARVFAFDERHAWR